MPDEIIINIIGPGASGRHFNFEKERPVEIEVRRHSSGIMINLSFEDARDLAQRLGDMLREHYERTGE